MVDGSEEEIQRWKQLETYGRSRRKAYEMWESDMEDRAKRALEAKDNGLVTTGQYVDPEDGHTVKRVNVPTASEKLHDAFYTIIRNSADVLTDDQEEIAAKYNQWLSYVEYPYEITGV